MVRTIVCAALALLLTAGLVVAQEKKKKKGQFAGGVIKKVDAATSTLTVTTGRKGMQEDKEFKLTADAKFVIITGDKKEELSVKDGFKAEQVKEGTRVRLTLNDKGEVTMVTIGFMPKKKKDG